jgi:hypothetical protein
LNGVNYWCSGNNDYYVWIESCYERTRRAPSARRQVDVQANTAILTGLLNNLNWLSYFTEGDAFNSELIDTPFYSEEPIRKIKSTFRWNICTFLFIVGLVGFF